MSGHQEQVISAANKRLGSSQVRYYENLRVTVPEIRGTADDGIKSDPLWSEGGKLSPFVTFYACRPAHSKTEVVLGYDATNLFIGIKAYFADVTKERSGGLEIMLQPSSKHANYRLSLALPCAAKSVKADLGPGFTELDGIEVKSAEADGCYTFNLAIPFNRLHVREIRSGDEWGINIIRHSIGATPASSWAPIRHSYFIDHESYYELRAVVSDEGRFGTIVFGPFHDSVLQVGAMIYVGFTEKVILIESGVDVPDRKSIMLEWISPSGQLQALDRFHISEACDGYKIAFSHPKPLEEGVYKLKLTLQKAEGKAAASSLLCFDRIELIEAGSDALQNTASSRSYSAEAEIVEIVVAPEPASEEVRRLIGLIPDRTGMTFVGTPDKADLWPYQLYDWQDSDPQRMNNVKSTYVYPNARYTENREFTLLNPKGEHVSYPYFEDERGKRFFLSAHIWSRSRAYVLEETDKLATSDPLGAARLLYHFALKYSSYFPVYDYPWLCYPLEKEAGAPYPYWGGLWNRWFYMDLYQLRHLFNAYGKVVRTNAFQVLTEETGVDVRTQIVDQMFLPSVHFVRTYPNMNTNMDFANWIGLAALGKALNEPKYIHEVVERLRAFCSSQFLFDGFWKEVTLSYHKQIMVGIRKVTDELLGWSDPDGYVSPRTGGHIAGLDMEKELYFIKQAERLLDDVAFPNGHALPVTDTWAYDKTETPNLETGSFLLPAAGIVKMTRGIGANQMQTYVTFVPKYGHNHLDPLNLVVFAHGQELLADIGYTHTKYRYATVSTIGHNTVVVDGADMRIDEGLDGGNIEVYTPADRMLQVVRASQLNAYSVTERYDREVWTIGFAEGEAHEAYVLDIFRVAGGNRHEYSLHGNANAESFFRTGQTMRPYGDTMLPAGADYVLPSVESEIGDAGDFYTGYMFIREVCSTAIVDGTYEAELVAKEGEDAERLQLRIFGNAGEGGSELFFGKSPSLKGTRVDRQDTNDLAEQYFVPQLIVRREGEALQSTFVTLLEPVGRNKQAQIRKMEVLRYNDASFGDAVVSIHYGNTTDIVLSSGAANCGQLVFGDIRLQGKMGFIRMEGSRVKQMMLVGGTELAVGQTSLVGAGTLKGWICAVLRRGHNHEANAFIVDIPVSEQFIGSHIIVAHPDGKTHGYLIHAIRPVQTGTLLDICDMDPGFTLSDDGSSEMNYFPHTKWTGKHAFHIDSVVHFVGSG
ncbi:heparinase II/III domain-containing protein [Paenibacillus contaminans]|uniref:Heparinase II/III-like C-terminal domain-containing protein n=1 Tax=Paenibacillus contaminans TaxID=450362 RepID=A0A329MMI4_9BACL|nr:heparinase II/III family protein [Paenibacillus contaminans]RAV21065.1 hypothetical protein DQG23_13380 [Paenibacillus contaminans]